MKKDVNKVLDNFIDDDEIKEEENQNQEENENVKTIIENDHSLIERVDKVILTKDGKQLLND